MNPKLKKPVVGLALIVICSTLLVPIFYVSSAKQEQVPSFFVGTMELGNNSQTQRNIDALQDYTNLVIISNKNVIENQSLLDSIVDYAFSKGLYFIVRMQYPSPHSNFDYNPFEWQQAAESKYGSHFLGYYIYDEPGGSQLDQGNLTIQPCLLPIKRPPTRMHTICLCR